MISIDTNLLFYATASSVEWNTAARAFLERMSERNDIALSEFVLVEFYRLLRNPSANKYPLNEKDATAIIQRFRHHPRWRVIGFPDESRRLHDDLWRIAATKTFAFRRIYDVRMALTLQSHGVTEFATANLKDFQNLGFKKVWNPLEEEGLA